MIIVKKDYLSDGTLVQIENWENVLKTLFKDKGACILAAYPVSKKSIKTVWADYYPLKGQSFRCSFTFDNEEECLEAFNALVYGKKQLLDYIEFYQGTLSVKDVIKCLK